MAVVVTNLTQGPGTLYTGAFGVAEPAETAVALAAAPGAGWTDVGGTSDGSQVSIAQEFAELEVDQVVDVPGRRITKRDVTLSTNLAEPTLENLAVAMNSGTVSTVDTTLVKKLVPSAETSVTQPTYKALLLDGFAPRQLRRRIIVRKVLSTNNVEFAYKKDEQTVFSVTWSAHYVSTSITPFVIYDDNPA